jgi:TP901 family phage tail tape measure protein
MASSVRTGLVISASLRGFQTFRTAGSAMEGLRNIAVRLRAELILLGGYFAFNFIKDTIRVFAEFDNSMMKVAAVTNSTAIELSRLREEALRLGREFPFTASEAADAMFELALAGLSVNEVMAATGDALKLAMAGSMELAESAAIAVATMNAFGMEATEIDDIGDKLSAAFTNSATTLDRLGAGLSFVGPVAQLAGVSLEDTITILGMFANAGISGARSGTTFRQMLARMLDPTAEAKVRMNQLGLSFSDAEGELLPLVDVIGQLIDKQVDANDVIKIFGVRAAPGIGALITQGTEGFQELNDEIVNSQGELDRIAETMGGSAANKLKLFTSSMEDLKVVLAEMLFPAIEEFIERFRKEGGVKDTVENAAAAISDFGSILFSLYVAIQPITAILFRLSAFFAEHPKLLTFLIQVYIAYKIILVALGIQKAIMTAITLRLAAAQTAHNATIVASLPLLHAQNAALWATGASAAAASGSMAGMTITTTAAAGGTTLLGGALRFLAAGFAALWAAIWPVLAIAATLYVAMAGWEYIVYGVKRAVEALIITLQKLANTMTFGLTDVGGAGTIFSSWGDKFSEMDSPSWRSLGFATGGVVPETGMYQLHAGETVRRAEGLDSDTQEDPRGAGSVINNISINVDGALDSSSTAKAIMQSLTSSQHKLAMR